MAFHVYDGDSYSVYSNLEEAKNACRDAINAARDIARNEGEWPYWIESIRIFEGSEDAEEPYDLPCVLTVIKINVNSPSSELDKDGYDDNGDWWPSDDAYNCDFDIAPLDEPKITQ